MVKWRVTRATVVRTKRDRGRERERVDGGENEKDERGREKKGARVTE